LRGIGLRGIELRGIESSPLRKFKSFENFRAFESDGGIAAILQPGQVPSAPT